MPEGIVCGGRRHAADGEHAPASAAYSGIGIERVLARVENGQRVHFGAQFDECAGARIPWVKLQCRHGSAATSTRLKKLTLAVDRAGPNPSLAELNQEAVAARSCGNLLRCS